MFRFLITPYVDDQTLASFRLWIDATDPDGGSPAVANGDLWLDLSGTDTSLGNATAGTLIAAAADYLVKLRHGGAWRNQFVGGQKGQRATIPLPFTPARGTRMRLAIECESADRRYQIEGLGFGTAPIRGAL